MSCFFCGRKIKAVIKSTVVWHKKSHFVWKTLLSLLHGLVATPYIMQDVVYRNVKKKVVFVNKALTTVVKKKIMFGKNRDFKQKLNKETTYVRSHKNS